LTLERLSLGEALARRLRKGVTSLPAVNRGSHGSSQAVLESDFGRPVKQLERTGDIRLSNLGSSTGRALEYDLAPRAGPANNRLRKSEQCHFSLTASEPPIELPRTCSLPLMAETPVRGWTMARRCYVYGSLGSTLIANSVAESNWDTSERPVAS